MRKLLSLQSLALVSTCRPILTSQPLTSQCLNGAPPIFGVETVTSQIAVGGLVDDPSEFSRREWAVMVASLERAIPSPPGSVSITEVCHANGQNCSSSSARRHGNALPRNLSSSPRSLLQTGATVVSVGFEVLSETLTPAALQSELSRPDFASALSRSIAQVEPTLGDIAIFDIDPPALIAPPSSRGERYIFDATGRANLWFCGTGYLLVNDSEWPSWCQLLRGLGTRTLAWWS